MSELSKPSTQASPTCWVTSIIVQQGHLVYYAFSHPPVEQLLRLADRLLADIVEGMGDLHALQGGESLS